MALSFACPACRAELQLPEEVAGQSGQCPRCQSLIRIPSSTHFRTELLERGPAAPPDLPPAPPPIPKVSPPERPAPPRRSPRTALPPAPPTPIWPVFVGVLGVLISTALLLASVIVLFSVRNSDLVLR